MYSLRQDIQTSCKDRIKCGERKEESEFYLWQSFETTFFAEQLFTTNRMKKQNHKIIFINSLLDLNESDEFQKSQVKYFTEEWCG